MKSQVRLGIACAFLVAAVGLMAFAPTTSAQPATPQNYRLQCVAANQKLVLAPGTEVAGWVSYERDGNAYCAVTRDGR